MHGVSTSRFKFDAIGTSWEIDTPVPLSPEIRSRILDLIERFDSVYSRFRDDSIVTRIANSPGGGTFTFPSGAIPMFDLYDRLYAATDGAVEAEGPRKTPYANGVYTATGEYGGQPFAYHGQGNPEGRHHHRCHRNPACQRSPLAGTPARFRGGRAQSRSWQAHR